MKVQIERMNLKLAQVFELIATCYVHEKHQSLHFCGYRFEYLAAIE